MNVFGFLWIASYISSLFSHPIPLGVPDDFFKALSSGFIPGSNNFSHRSAAIPQVHRVLRLKPRYLRLRSILSDFSLGRVNHGRLSPVPSTNQNRLWFRPVETSFVGSLLVYQPALAVAEGERLSFKLPMLPDRSARVERPYHSKSQRFVQRLQNLPYLPQSISQNLLPVLPSVTVIRAGHYTDDEGTPVLQPTGSLQCSTSRSSSMPSAEPTFQPVFQIRVKDKVVAELPSQARADEIAKRLEQVLKDPNLDASSIQLARIDGMPGAVAGNEFLFMVDKTLARQLQQDNAAIATKWVNKLRTVLGAPALTALEIETQMSGLVETGRLLNGIASWYGPYFHGRLTANGEIFDENELTAAHPSLPFNTYLLVTNLRNGKRVIVRVNDRGPYIGSRSLDLSRKAARCLGSESVGVVPYEAAVLKRSTVEPVISEPGSVPTDPEPSKIARRLEDIN